MTERHADLAELEAALRRRFRVVETAVTLGSHAVSLLHPASAEDLIDEIEFERDERLPYWAELWPSSRVLAEHLLQEPGKGRSLLELGCGAGLVSVCAARAHFAITVSDYYEDAMRFARVNVWRNARRAARTMLLDWRTLPRDLPTFDVVVASDVLYERPYGVLVARAIASTLGRAGTALVADPGRVGRDDFTREIGRAGLELRDRTQVAYVDDQIRQKITIYEVGWRPA